MLSMQNIDKSFNGKTALKEVSLDVDYGEIHALLGENGAGKTTLMNILYGIYQRDSGSVIWQGEPVAFSSPHDAISRRIGMVHQHFKLVPSLTVSENITLGLRPAGYPFVRRSEVNEEIRRLSIDYGLDVDPAARVDSLSVGEQQRVEIMKLLYRNSQLLIFDEPTAVLTPQEAENFFLVLDKIKSDGRSAIIITHRIPEVMRVTDRVTVLRGGRNAGSFKTSDINDKTLSSHMIGHIPAPIRRETVSLDSPGGGLVLRNLRFIKNGIAKIDGIDLCVASGEIVGVAGVDGNGQKELAELVLGLLRPAEGGLVLAGTEMTDLSVRERKKLGMGYISDDRLEDGLIGDMSLAENMLLKTNAPGHFVRNGLIDFKAVRMETQRAVDEYSIKTPSVDTPVRLLSGGNQQKLILAREMDANPKALVAFQPARGLDIGAADFVHRRLLEHRSGGCRILLISADLEEILALSDRVAVICKGRLTGILPNTGDIDTAHLGLLMSGREVQNG